MSSPPNPSNPPPCPPPTYELPIDTLPPYPSPSDPSPPEYFEIIRFNASSYIWTATNAQLQAAIDAGGISPTTTPDTRNNEARSVTTAAIFYLPEERSLEAMTRAVRRQGDEREREMRREEAEVVRQHCRPSPRTSNSVRSLSSVLQRWGDILEEAEQHNAVSPLKRESTLEERTVDVPGWMKVRTEERGPKYCRKWRISRLFSIRKGKLYTAF